MRRVIVGLAVALVLGVSGLASGGYIKVAYPGSTNTYARGVSGTNVVGQYYSCSGMYGFHYDATNGTYTTLAPQVAGVQQPTMWDAVAVSGSIVAGNYYIASVGFGGFIFDTATSSYTTGIEGKITGISGNTVVGVQWVGGSEIGFSYDGSTYTQIAVPGASRTSVVGVSGNNIAGNYTVGGVGYGFVYDGSTYTTIASGIVGVSGNSVIGRNWLYDGSTYTELMGEATAISGSIVVGRVPSGVGGVGGGPGEASYIFDGSDYTVFQPFGAGVAIPTGVSDSNVVGIYSRDGNHPVYSYLYTGGEIPGDNTAVPAPSSLTALIGVGVMVFGMEWWKKRRRARCDGRRVLIRT